MNNENANNSLLEKGIILEDKPGDATESLTTSSAPAEELQFREENLVSLDFFTKILFFLIIFLGAAYFILNYLKSKYPIRFSSTINKEKKIRVIASRNISQKTIIHQIEIDNEKYIVAESSQHIILEKSTLDTKKDTNIAEKS